MNISFFCFGRRPWSTVNTVLPSPKQINHALLKLLASKTITHPHRIERVPRHVASMTRCVMCAGKLHIFRLLNPARWFWFLAHLVCICIFIVQLFQLLPSYFAPTMTHTEVRELQLKNLDFPVNIKICAKPDFNKTALQELGYRDSSDFILGRSKFNRSIISWGGHSGKKASAKEVLESARIGVTQDLLSRVSFKTISGKTSGNLVDRVFLEKINHVSECHILNLTNIDKGEKKGMKWINIRLSKEVMEQNNLTVELKLQGKSLATSREIAEHGFFSKGSPLKIDYLTPKLLKYIVRMEKDVFVEEDPSKGCRNYPNSDFSSYKECDSKYLRDRVMELSSDLNLTPPWFTEDLNTVSVQPMLVPKELLGTYTRQYVVLHHIFPAELSGLISGVQPSDCPLPCATVSTEIQPANENEEKLGFQLLFQQRVQVRGKKSFEITRL